MRLNRLVIGALVIVVAMLWGGGDGGIGRAHCGGGPHCGGG